MIMKRKRENIVPKKEKKEKLNMFISEKTEMEMNTLRKKYPQKKSQRE